MDVLGALTAHMQVELGEDKPRDEKGKFAPRTPAEAPKAEEAAPQEEAPAEEEQKPAEEETEEPAQPEVRRHKLTVKSEEGSDVELEVDEEELKKGYMLEKSYRHKTAQLAREREAVQAKIKEATDSKLKEYDEKLQMAEQAIWHTLAPEIQNVDWNKLAEENPAEWAKRYQHVQNVNGKLAQIQQERQKLAKAREDEVRTNQRKQAEEANETLKTEIPGWGNELYGKILKAAVDQGFKSEEANNITDPRAIKALWKAMQYDALQKAKPSVEKRSAPQTPKVVKPGGGEKTEPGADKWKQGMEGLKKSGGKWQNGVPLVMEILGREGK
jgi:hypothetical protein